MRKRIPALLAAGALLLCPASPASASGADEPVAQTDPTGPVYSGEAFSAWAELDGAAVDEAVFREEAVPVQAEALDVAAPSAILMERETGTVLWEKNADERLEPASVTKIMTLLLVAEAVDAGTLSAEDTVTASAYAASMGGSQVFLEENERMTVEELVKCVAVSSANDAAVALAEHLCGSESAFVAGMNRRAAELGMENTVFQNCTGLPGAGEHLTTARDIALMSRALLAHDWIRPFVSTWMDTVRGGAFDLANTNKLIYYYDGATGLKTGFTQSAGYCLSASAMREDVEYIAVVLHCETSAERFESAKQLLNFAFANYTLLRPEIPEAPGQVAVRMGAAASVGAVPEGAGPVVVTRARAAEARTVMELPESVEAPVEAGQVLGTVTVLSGEETIVSVPLKADAAVPRLTLPQVWGRLLALCFAGRRQM